LHKSRFYYKSTLFNHVHFKNQHKNLKKKKFKKINERKQNHLNSKVQTLRNVNKDLFLGSKGNVITSLKKQKKKIVILKNIRKN